jgi:two-component system NtrC family sensor kinase
VRMPSGTARRLIYAFTGLLTIFAVSSYFALASLRDIQGGLTEIKERENGVRLALTLASAVRDQYAHQAHTIILGNDSHLPFYSEAERRVVELTAAVKQRVREPDELAWVAEIEKATVELDRIFRQRIVPAVLRRQATDVMEEHGQAQVQVTQIQGLTDRLVDRFETSIGDIENQVREVRQAAFRWTILFLAGAPLLAGGIGLSIYRSVARPVARMRDGAARLAAGDLEARIDIDSPDEFGDLARQFNAMAGSIKDQQERLVQSEKLAGIGRLAAGVAHEINNPLAVILGYANLLQRAAQGQVAEDLRIIEVESLRAQEIVEGLLDLSRPMATAPEPVDLRELCDEATARLSETGRLAGALVEVGGVGTVAGHPQKLRQVMLNLIKNGAEAAGPGGRVQVGITPGLAGEVEIVVSDSGPGLPPEATHKLFEPFFTTKPTGTGLGLAVSLGIVQAHGGSLQADSPASGGARFTIRLPASPPGKV